MNHESTTQSVLVPALFSKPVVAKLDEEHSSSDGGVLLLKAIDERLGLSKSLAGCLRDSRQAGKVAHETIELMRQRIFAIALGYPDGNDARELSDDPLHKLAVGRDPVQGGSLASQPTLSRFSLLVAGRAGTVAGRRYPLVIWWGRSASGTVGAPLQRSPSRRNGA